MDLRFSHLGNAAHEYGPLDCLWTQSHEMEHRMTSRRKRQRRDKRGGQRSPWLVDAKKLADYIDLKKKEAENDWLKMRA